MTTYTFEHTYFIDGDPDCPCCSGLQFDTYTLIKVDGVDINTEFEYDRCSWEDDCYKVASHHYNKVSDGEYPYDDVGDYWRKEECERLGVHIEIIGGMIMNFKQMRINLTGFGISAPESDEELGARWDHYERLLLRRGATLRDIYGAIINWRDRYEIY